MADAERAPLYQDRQEAGRRLARELAAHRGPGTLVLGIARGGVPVAAVVARALGAALDVLVAKKIGAPKQPELALGAVTADGATFFNEDIVAELGVPRAYLAGELARKSAEARRRESELRGGRAAPSIAGRTVILIDDGLATGATTRACARSIRAKRPAKLIVATPVGSREACWSIASEADEILCLEQPEPFYAVGLHYRDFDQVGDGEVKELLARAAAEPGTR